MRIAWIRIWVILIALAIFAGEAVACQIAVPTFCQAYSRAESVFVGKLTRVEKVDGLRVRGHFEIRKIYKGSASKREVATFSGGDCGPDLSRVGEDYFVFKGDYEPRIANLTGPLSRHATSLKFAERTLSRKPVFRISGHISLRNADLKHIKISANDGHRSAQVRIDQHGFFDFSTTKPASYVVTVSLPFEASVTTEILGEFFESAGRTITYEVLFRPNECDYREFDIGMVRK